MVKDKPKPAVAKAIAEALPKVAEIKRQRAGTVGMKHYDNRRVGARDLEASLMRDIAFEAGKAGISSNELFAAAELQLEADVRTGKVRKAW